MNFPNKIFLLVDDDKDDRDLFVEAIESIKIMVKCHVSHNGQGALDLLSGLSDHLPHVIFLDINMPVMNGWDCLRKLKADDKYKNIPVIMCSTSSSRGESKTAFDLGALCFCTKPDSFSILKQTLEIVSNNLGENLLDAIKKSNIRSFQFKK